MAEERDDECYTLHLTIHDIKLLHYCVKEGIKIGLVLLQDPLKSKSTCGI